MQSESSMSPSIERRAKAAKTSDGEFLKLNANCCYNDCIGCSSVRKLREFRARWPEDWQLRLRGSERLRAEAERVG